MWGLRPASYTRYGIARRRLRVSHRVRGEARVDLCGNGMGTTINLEVNGLKSSFYYCSVHGIFIDHIRTHGEIQ